MSTTKKKAYLHLDTETTSLRPWKGHIRSLACVATDGNLDPISQFEHTELVAPELWDKGTWDWAAKTYGSEFIELSMEGGLKDWRHVWHHFADAFSSYVKGLERDGWEVWIVANHTNFDVTLLQVVYDMLTRPFPVKYNNTYDLQSLLMGQEAEVALILGEPVRNLYTVRGLADARPDKEAVAHHALQDALDQLAMLVKAGVKLPL